jgi:hypothetical protein
MIACAKAVNSAFGRPTPDDLLWDRVGHHLRRQLWRGQWQEVHKFLEATTDWGIRHFYVQELSRIRFEGDQPKWLDEWARACPDSAVRLLFRGSRTRWWAWQARGSGRAAVVKPDAWPVFHERLVTADQELGRAAALDPADPTPHVIALTVARGLSLGQAEARRRFDEVHRRDPFNAAACSSMIQATSRKWGGSTGAMLDFARWASGAAPDGHSAHKAIPLAHIEVWLDQSSAQQRRQYFEQPQVRAEIREAAARSIWSPRYRGGLLAWSDRNVFAFCFSRTGDGREALEQMRLIGQRVTRFPWEYDAYRGDVGAAYQRTRGKARAAARRQGHDQSRPGSGWSK